MVKSFIDRLFREIFPLKPSIVPVWSRCAAIISEYRPLPGLLALFHSSLDAETSTDNEQDRSERIALFKSTKCVTIQPEARRRRGCTIQDQQRGACLQGSTLQFYERSNDPFSPRKFFSALSQVPILKCIATFSEKPIAFLKAMLIGVGTNVLEAIIHL